MSSNLVKTVGYFVGFIVGFIALRFVLALIVSPLEHSMSDSALTILFWTLQGVALGALAMYFWGKSEKLVSVAAIIAFILTLLVGPMN